MLLSSVNLGAPQMTGGGERSQGCGGGPLSEEGLPGAICPLFLGQTLSSLTLPCWEEVATGEDR